MKYLIAILAIFPTICFAQTKTLATGTNNQVLVGRGTNGADFWQDATNKAQIQTALSGGTTSNLTVSGTFKTTGSVRISSVALDVKSYGAVGNGVADDSAAIQAAIDAADASSDQKTVLVSTGTFKCNVTLPPQVNLIGAGATTGDSGQVARTRMTPANNSVAVITMTVLGGQSIADIDISGNGAGTSAMGINISNGESYPGGGLMLTDLYIHNFTIGINNDAGIEIIVQNASVIACGNPVKANIPTSLQRPSTMTFIGGYYNATGTNACFWIDGASGTNLIGIEAGNCGSLIYGQNEAQFRISAGNFESFSEPIVELNSGFLDWAGSNVQSFTGTKAIVRVRGADGAGVTLNALRLKNYLNYGSFGAPLVIETFNTPRELMQIHGFKGVVRIASGSTYSTFTSEFIQNSQNFDSLSPSADKVAYFTGTTGAMGLTTVTSMARSFLDDTTNAAMLTTLGANAGSFGLTGTTSAIVSTTSGSRTVSIQSYAADNNYVTAAGSVLSIGTSDAHDIRILTNNTNRGSVDTAGQIFWNNNFIFSGTNTGLKFREGSNAKMGVVTLSGGTTTVSTTAVSGSSRIFLTRAAPNASTGIGQLSVTAVSSGTSFSIGALTALGVAEAGDASAVNWFIVDPAP